LEVPLETIYAAIAFGKRHGVRTVLNPAPAAPDIDARYVRDVSYLAPNETELALLTGKPTGTEAEVEAAARGLLSQGVEAVIVTLGARGALLATADRVQRIAPVPVEAVDTTGAGDAFVASFARFHAGGLSLSDALAKAALYAADSVRRAGSQKSYATAAEFAAFERSREARGT
jgi:ribokinase